MQRHFSILSTEFERGPSLNNTGVLPYQRLKEFVGAGYIRASEPITEEQLQPASLDLRLGTVGYQLRASFLPGKSSTVESKLEELAIQKLDLTTPTLLQKGGIYLFNLLEELNLPDRVSGKANPKSTTGRLDVFSRLITDHTDEFERVGPGYKGGLYAEVAPRSFNIIVQAGDRLNQLRLIQGNIAPTDANIDALQDRATLVYLPDGTPIQADLFDRRLPTLRDEKGRFKDQQEDISNFQLRLTVDLGSTGNDKIVGFKAVYNAPPIELNKVDYYDPRDFWEPLFSPQKRQIILNPGDFYLLWSRQKVSIRNDYAAEMVAYDPSIGELRIHYAGFFDPGFGYGLGEVQGTRAVLEVRSHDVPFLLQDEQRVGSLIYEKLLATPEKVYGVNAGSSYQHQTMGLSKQFKSWQI
ncbi:MAG: 2'-deoxycytidine 5'-triphosphate deaminase [Dehalococcoidia bacterium]|nr:2'-deoxycytidine 5'-triphosphate deaminase [Dehalococcoidia bacterium]